jgi:hypothetical protein
MATTKETPKVHGMYRDSQEVTVRPGDTAHYSKVLETFPYRPGRKGVYRLSVEDATHGGVLRAYVSTLHGKYDGPGKHWTECGFLVLRDVTEGTLEVDVPRHIGSPVTPPVTHVRGYFGATTPTVPVMTVAPNGGRVMERRPVEFEPYTVTLTLDYSEVEA